MITLSHAYPIPITFYGLLFMKYREQIPKPFIVLINQNMENCVWYFFFSVDFICLSRFENIFMLNMGIFFVLTNLHYEITNFRKNRFLLNIDTIPRCALDNDRWVSVKCEFYFVCDFRSALRTIIFIIVWVLLRHLRKQN